jgi:translocation and assembly module TamB
MTLLKRIFFGLTKSLGLLLVFVLALVLGVLAHLDSAPGRRAAKSITNSVLGGMFKGTIVVDRIGGIGVDGLTGVDGHLVAATGEDIAELRGVRMRTNVPSLVGGIISWVVRGKEPLTIRIETIEIEHATLLLDRTKDEKKELLVAAAFVSATPPEPKALGPGPSVSIARIYVKHAWVRGMPADGLAVDADIEPLVGAFSMANGRIDVRVSELRLRAREVMPAQAASLLLVGSLTLPENNGGLVARATLGGEVAHVPLFAEAVYSEAHMTVVAGVPNVPAAVISNLVPGIEPRGDLSVRIEAAGTLAKLEAIVHVSFGPGNLDAYARAALAGNVYVELGARVRDLDIANFADGAPASRLGAELVGKMHIPSGGAMRADAKVVLDPSSHVAGQAIPATTVVAVLEDSGRLKADLFAQEPGVPTTVHVELLPARNGKPRPPLVFTTETTITLGDFTRFGMLGEGSGRLSTRGTFDLTTLVAHASADADLAGIGARGAKLRAASIHVDANGPVQRLALDGEISGRGIRYAKYGAERFDASARVDLGDAIVIADAKVSATSKGETLRLSAPRVVLHGGVDASDVTISGLGEPLTADISLHGNHVALKARTAGLDLGKAGVVLQMNQLGGHVILDADLTLDGKEIEGKAGFSLDDGSFPGVSKAHANVDADVHARVASVDVEASLGDAFELRISSKRVKLAGPALLASSWKRAAGAGWLDARGDLQRLVEVLALEDIPVTPTHGKARVQLGFTSIEGSRLPSLDLAVSTSGLAFLVSHSKPNAAATEYRGFDGAAEAHIDGATGFSALSARLRDARGNLAMVDAKLHVPLELALANPKGAIESLYDEPIGIHVLVPERKLSNLPPELGAAVAELRGRGSVELTLEGTVRKPQLVVDLRGKNLKIATASKGSDFSAQLRYDGDHATFDATLMPENAGKVVIKATLDAESAKLLAGVPPTALPWKAGADVTFERFALATLPTSAEGRIRGNLDGHVKLTNLHENAELDIALAISDASVGGADIPKGTVAASVKGGRASVNVRLDPTDGKLEFDAALGLAWGNRIVPEIDKTKAIEARLYAKELRAAIFGPFTGGTLTDLDGRIDADARGSVDSTGKNAKLEGYVAARSTTFVIASVGQEYRDVAARVSFAPGGVINVDGITLSDGSGLLTGKATARLRDLDFVGANAVFSIGKGQPIDLFVGGQVLGEVYGRFDVAVRNSAQGLGVNLVVPSLHMRLAESAGKAVQELAPNKDVRVGFLRGDSLVIAPMSRSKTAQDPASEPTKGSANLDIDVKLGNDVEIKRGSMVAVTLTGGPHIKLANGKTTVTGQIQVPSGTLDLQGKKFTVEKGTVTFEGDDPANPVVVATASWQAKDRTLVYADFIGPVKTGKVTLRAEPARSQSEILQLVVFGTADGFNAAPGAGTKPGAATQAATTVAGGALTQGLDSALDGLTGIQTQTRIDTTSSNNPRPELEVVVSRDVSIRFAYVLGTPPISEPDKSLGSVIFRFAPHWTVSTTVGDRGKATIDTVWQYRY